MQLNPKLFGIRETDQQFHVFYDVDTGQTAHIIRYPSKEQLAEDHIVVPIDNPLVVQVMEGKLSIGQLIVAFDKDTNKRSLFKKDQYLRRVHEENSTLLGIKRVAEVDPSTQVVLALYSSGILEITVNKNSLDSFVSIVNSENEKYEGYDHLHFYFVNAKDPAKLYGRIVVDTTELINNGSVKVSAPWYSKDLANKIVTYTKRVFSTYQVVTRDVYIETPEHQKIETMQYPADVTVTDDCHISIDVSRDFISVNSKMIDPMKYNIFDELNLHVVKNKDPNQYIRTVTLTLDQLKNKGTVLLEKVLDESMGVVHDNPCIKVNIRKLNESTNDRV